ncbi:MAG: hypothetical protein JWQ90_2430 [Hydrocarboniphaga sp.]|nr:hypothetical protein [Hydrocarboniphaga sp.]
MDAAQIACNAVDDARGGRAAADIRERIESGTLQHAQRWWFGGLVDRGHPCAGQHGRLHDSFPKAPERSRNHNGFAAQ